MGTLHVMPRSDLIEHDADESCPCGPTPRPEKANDGSVGWTIVHHSLDGREVADVVEEEVGWPAEPPGAT